MDRLARRALVLLAFIMLLPTAVEVFGRIHTPELQRIAREFGALRPGVFSDGLTAVVIVLFIVGLGVRLARAARRDPHTRRLREATQRRARLAARHAAEDVPVHEVARPAPRDVDPPLPL